jgi:hypothetical protein
MVDTGCQCARPRGAIGGFGLRVIVEVRRRIVGLLRRGPDDVAALAQVRECGFDNVKRCIIDLTAITQSGGWKSPRMPLQYAEKINAARSGMARASTVAGRDNSTTESQEPCIEHGQDGAP